MRHLGHGDFATAIFWFLKGNDMPRVAELCQHLVDVYMEVRFENVLVYLVACLIVLGALTVFYKQHLSC